MQELLLISNSRTPSPPFAPPTVTDNSVFKGFVKSSELVDGDRLASLLGVSSGVSHNYDAGWLKYVATDGMVFYIARKTLRYRASAAAIRNATNGKTITIDGKEYIVRSLSGRAVGSNTDGVGTAGGEWNQYIYPIYSGSRRSAFPSGTPQWSSYTDSDLGLAEYQAPMFNGSSTLVSDAVSIGSNSFGTRGTNGTNPPTGDVVGSYYQDGSTIQSYQGWRPILIEKSTQPVYPFRGEVTQTDLISFADLATAVGLTTTSTSSGVGMPLNTGDVWLHYIDGDKEFYVTKKPIRNYILWTKLNELGIVNGSKTIDIDGKTFKVRLMTGTATNPGNTAGGEWNKYFYPIYNQPGVTSTEFQSTRWANYTNADLGVSNSANNGALSLMQDVQNANTNPVQYATRGWASDTSKIMLNVFYQPANSTNQGYGWRPVLELVK